MSLLKTFYFHESGPPELHILPLLVAVEYIIDNEDQYHYRITYSKKLLWLFTEKYSIYVSYDKPPSIACFWKVIFKNKEVKYNIGKIQKIR